MAQVKRGLDWLVPMQVLDVRGDWSARRPDLRPGGWAFQYANPHYPDVDDTAVVAMAMDRCRAVGRGNYRAAIARAREWIVGMQSKNGGWGAFDADNDYYYLNNIPFADHGALLDPPTEDVTRALPLDAGAARRHANSPAAARAIDYLRRTQAADGSWFGRWGMNYIYGTWSVLCALNAAGVRPATRRKCARPSTGSPPSRTRTAAGARTAPATSSIIAATRRAPSTASQTAWALLGLMAAGEVDHPAVARGIEYLADDAGRRRLLGRAALHRDGFPARVLSALPRLFEILPALGAGALPQSENRQCGRSGVRDVNRRRPSH